MKNRGNIFDKFFPETSGLLKGIRDMISDTHKRILYLEEELLELRKAQIAEREIIQKFVKDKMEYEHNVGKSRFEKTVEYINKRSLEIEVEIKGEKEELINKLNVELTEKNLNIQERLDILKTKLLNLEKYVEKEYLYTNQYERKVISSFEDLYYQENYRDNFLDLIRGLPEEDINKIVLILKRQREVLENSGDLDIFQEEEQKQIKAMIKSLKNEVYRVDDNLFVYKNYFLPVNHFEASVFYYKHGINEIKNIQYTYEKDIVDVGGFIGDSVLVLKPYTNKKIYSFEAVQENYNLLLQTIKLNNLDNVVAENVALGSTTGVIEIQVAGSASSFSECHSTVYGTEKVKMIRLDDYVKKNKLNVGLIKIDIEGAEQDFLAGAKETIIEQKPILLCSIYHNASDFFHIKPLLESWNVGYKFHIHKPIDFSVSREVLLIAEP